MLRSIFSYILTTILFYGKLAMASCVFFILSHTVIAIELPNILLIKTHQFQNNIKNIDTTPFDQKDEKKIIPLDHKHPELPQNDLLLITSICSDFQVKYIHMKDFNECKNATVNDGKFYELSFEAYLNRYEAVYAETARKRLSQLRARSEKTVDNGHTLPISAQIEEKVSSGRPISHRSKVALVIRSDISTSADHSSNNNRNATDIATALSDLRFDVDSILYNADRKTLEKAIADFALKAEGAEVAFVFFAGHGIQMSAENHSDFRIVPIDSKITNNRDIEHKTVSIDRILSSISGARYRILVADYCRDKKLSGLASYNRRHPIASRSLARAESLEKNLITFYSAQNINDTNACDDHNSSFTTSLLRHIREPRDIGLIMRSVSADVAAATKNRQIPLITDSLVGDLVLADR